MMSFHSDRSSLFASSEFLLDKRIAFADEDKQYSNRVWAAEETIDASKVKMLLGDTGDQDMIEWTLLVSLNDEKPFAFKWSKDKATGDEEMSACFEQGEAWYPAGIPFLAKILNGFENLHMRSFVLRWKKVADYVSLYQALIRFLKSE